MYIKDLFKPNLLLFLTWLLRKLKFLIPIKYYILKQITCCCLICVMLRDIFTVVWTMCFILYCTTYDAGKSLARPGRKQATATRLGIYSTYSPRSSKYFLARCSNFCKALKKNQKVIRPTRSPRQQWPPRRAKNRDLSIFFFQSRKQVVVRRGQIRRMEWVIKTVEALVGQFLLGRKCPVSRGIVVQEQNPLSDLPAAFFLQKSLNCTSRDK